MKPNPIKDKSYEFAIRCIRLWNYLIENKKEYVLSKQVIRSGTSIWANIREAQNAQSNSDFVHKLSISQKEADETLYWIELLKDTQYISEIEYQSLENDLIEIIKLLCTIIKTSKSKH